MKQRESVRVFLVPSFCLTFRDFLDRKAFSNTVIIIIKDSGTVDILVTFAAKKCSRGVGDYIPKLAQDSWTLNLSIQILGNSLWQLALVHPIPEDHGLATLVCVGGDQQTHQFRMGNSFKSRWRRVHFLPKNKVIIGQFMLIIFCV